MKKKLVTKTIKSGVAPKRTKVTEERIPKKTKSVATKAMAKKNSSSKITKPRTAKNVIKAKSFVNAAITDMKKKGLSAKGIKISEELLKDDLDNIKQKNLTSKELQIARDILENKLEGKIPHKFQQNNIKKPCAHSSAR